MKKIVIRAPGGVDALELIAAPEPIAGPGQIVVQAEAMGVGWPDVLIRRGSYRWMPELPASPGSDLAGRVVEIGDGVDSGLLGRRVLITARELSERGGCYVERLAVPASAVFVLPEASCAREAVCLPNYQVAWNLVHEIEKGRPVRRIFVNGVAGSIGLAVTQIARDAGMVVFGSVSSAQRLAIASAHGVDYPLDRNRCDPVAEVMRLTGNEGVDLVIDHVAGPRFADLLGMLAPWGTLVSYNISQGLPDGNLLEALRRYGDRCPAIRILEMHRYDHDRSNRRRIMDAVIAAWSEKRIRPIVGRAFALADVRQAHTALEEGQVVGKIVLHP